MLNVQPDSVRAKKYLHSWFVNRKFPYEKTVYIISLFTKNFFYSILFHYIILSHCPLNCIYAVSQ